MDANNFNILWTEASWVGNKTLTPQYLNQGNCLNLKQTTSKTHNLILLKEKWNNISIKIRRKTKQNSLPWRNTQSLLCCHMVGWLAGPQWSLEGHRVAVRTLVRLCRNHSGFFLFVWTQGGVYGCERLISVDWHYIHPSFLEEEGNENRALTF